MLGVLEASSPSLGDAPAVKMCLSNLRRAWYCYLTVRFVLLVRYSQGRGFLNLVG
jgi:hypothetical protein